MSSAPDTDLDGLTFDQALAQLQQVVRALEGGELSLEDSLKAFEKGVRLSRACQKHLSAADQRIDVLVRGGEGGAEPELGSFQPGSGTSDETRKNKA